MDDGETESRIEKGLLRVAGEPVRAGRTSVLPVVLLGASGFAVVAIGLVPVAGRLTAPGLVTATGAEAVEEDSWRSPQLRAPEKRLLIAFPGDALAHVRPGVSIRYSLEGFGSRYYQGSLRMVRPEVLSGNEVRRIIGQRYAHGIAGPGPYILSEASLPGGTIEIDGRRHPYLEGMRAQVSIQGERRRLLAILMPSLGR